MLYYNLTNYFEHQGDREYNPIDFIPECMQLLDKQYLHFD